MAGQHPAGDGRVDARPTLWAIVASLNSCRPSVRARRRRHARTTWSSPTRRGGTLDDVTATPSCCAMRGPATATPSVALGHGHPTAGWWEGLIGPGLAIDTDRWFVVCANVLGGCQGSTGPASPHPVDGEPYGSRFPVVTIRDMVRAQARLADHLSIPVWHSVIGGSMGGMQVLEWAIMFPHRVRSIVPIATCAQATAQQIAWGAIGRRAIRLDPLWRGGDYYDAATATVRGRACRSPAWSPRSRSAATTCSPIGSAARSPMVQRCATALELWQRFEVERYLDYHGDKLVRRFDANSYLVIGKAMDLHDVSRHRGGLESVMARIKVPTLTIGISSDILYPSYQQRQIRDLLVRRRARRASTWRSIHRTVTTRS